MYSSAGLWQAGEAVIGRFLRGLLLVLLIVAVLVAFFPASWAWRLARDHAPQLQVGALHGSVWNGRAEDVVYAGMPLGEVDWTLSRLAVFGHLRLDARVDGPLLRGDGRLQRRGDVLIGRDLHAVVHAQRLPITVGSPGLQPMGDVEIDIARLHVRDRWPQQLDGTVSWQAALADAQGPVSLGRLHARLHEQAGTTLIATLGDDGGPLALSGQAQVSLLGWRLDARLQARDGATRVRQVLSHLGPLQQDGTLIVRRQSGALMGAAR
ncbi:hypothetical protein LF63_0111850 [Oleiagrimonas soli]|uniref:Type II secretion system protein N n=1 Tax=Oleiagrimonas soli TaxID=1543381 RepID=A0A099CTZ8_9GAMM|nr:hypothetical protein LF63_0111850 [Oleiagrimonas soli]